jgi:hypothetical protein
MIINFIVAHAYASKLHVWWTFNDGLCCAVEESINSFTISTSELLTNERKITARTIAYENTVFLFCLKKKRF